MLSKFHEPLDGECNLKESANISRVVQILNYSSLYMIIHLSFEINPRGVVEASEKCLRGPENGNRLTASHNVVESFAFYQTPLIEFLMTEFREIIGG